MRPILTAPYRSDAPEIGLGRDTESLCEVRKKRNETMGGEKGTRRSTNPRRSPEVGKRSDVIKTRA